MSVTSRVSKGGAAPAGVASSYVITLAVVDTTPADAGMDAGAWVALGAAIVSLIALAITIWQAQSARSQAHSARVQAEAATRQTEFQERIHRESTQPYVHVDFVIDADQGGLVHLVVQNKGPTVAEDVRINFEPRLQCVGLSTSFDPVLEQLTHGLRAMPPGRTLKWTFALGHRLFDDSLNHPLSYVVTINGRGPYGALPTLVYPLDLGEFKHAPDVPSGSLRQVAQAIDGLTKATLNNAGEVQAN
jgi:hypothetical protein